MTTVWIFLIAFIVILGWALALRGNSRKIREINAKHKARCESREIEIEGLTKLDRSFVRDTQEIIQDFFGNGSQK